MVAAARMLARLDQEQFATDAGLSASTSTVSKIEQGRRNVREETLGAVQQALERSGVDLTQNGRTGHHAVGASYGCRHGWCRSGLVKRAFGLRHHLSAADPFAAHAPTAAYGEELPRMSYTSL